MNIKIYQSTDENLYLKGIDKLLWCKLVSANLTFNKDENHYNLWYVLHTEDGNITCDAKDLHLYTQNGLECEKTWETRLNLPETVKSYNVHDDEFGHYKTVVFDGVTPVDKEIVPLEASYRYEEGRDRFTWVITWNTNLDLKNDCYTSLEECQRWNRCLVRDEDGTEHWEEGALYPLRLSEEQKMAAIQFDEACQKLKEAGIELIIGAYGSGAFMVNHAEEEIADCWDCPDWGGDWNEIDTQRLFYSPTLAKVIVCSSCSDDNKFWLKEKEDQ